MQFFGIYGGDVHFREGGRTSESQVIYRVFCSRLLTERPDPFPSRQGHILSWTDAPVHVGS